MSQQDKANLDDKGILLETGTNEFEIVEFSIGGVHYGINVAKVREVINRLPVTDMPKAHPNVDGLFTLRNKVIPLVNLPRCLNVESGGKAHNIIVTEINGYQMGFLVDNVSRIHRISWKAMEPAPNVSENSLVVGIIKMHDKVVMLLDFEQIMSDINPEINKKLSTFEDVHSDIKSLRRQQKIIVAEDSPMLRDILVNTLHDAGYSNVIDFANGQLAWDYLSQIAKGADYNTVADLLISDIEMPQMDGHRLVTLIREHRELKALPAVFFSSLINEEMRIKGESVGANAQVSKPEIGQLIEIVDDLLFKPDEKA